MPTLLDGYRLFHRASAVLADMEFNGIAVDEKYLDSVIAETTEKITRLERRLQRGKVWDTWVKAYGIPRIDREGRLLHGSNLDSGPQMGAVLFDKLGYKGERTAGGKVWKTDEDSLRKIGGKWITRFLERKKLLKLRDTYLIGLKREVIGGFVHPFQHLAAFDDDTERGAGTFRSSSSNPNIHNQPNRLKHVAEVLRKAFVARPGRRLVEVDFSSHEFIMAAVKWKDPRMMEYAVDPAMDIHCEMAQRLYLLNKLPIREFKAAHKSPRDVAKNQFVFPVLYGSDYINISKGLWEFIEQLDLKGDGGIPMKDHLAAKGITELGTCDRKMPPRPGTFERHVKAVQDWWMAEFSTFARSADNWYRKYQRTGEIRLQTGFRCGPGLFSKNFILNVDIQGPSFHCLLWSLIEMRKRIRREKKRTLIVAQIHDCSLSDTPDDEVQWLLTTTKQIMTVDILKAWPWICVPLKCEADVTDIGGTWLGKKPWREREDGLWVPA